MNCKYILISGSAGFSCPDDKLDTAIEFIRSFTKEVLRRGGGLVVLAGNEETTKDECGTPRVFDWVALREVEQYVVYTTESARRYIQVVMSDKAWEFKIDDANLQSLRNLEQRNAVTLHYIPRENFTGGEYRKAQIEVADAMLAIGGGKGTYSVGTDMTKLSKPVLPLDLRIDSISDDGIGSVALHREMMAEPSRFFPATHSDVKNKIGMLALNRSINDVGAVAQVAAEILDRELNATENAGRWMKTKQSLAAVWKFAQTISVIAATIKILESIRGIF